MVVVEHLTKNYGSFRAVNDLTFEVGSGEILGFLGPNGAGKTTTMRMLTGYLPPSHGRIAIDGFDLLTDPVKAKQRIGYLPENPPVYPEMTVRQYLDFVSEIKDVPSSRRASQVDSAIQRARLEEVRNKRISALSKGFKQRVGLAQAIVHDPPVLVLDEPTSSLDPKQRVEVRDLIAGLKGDHTVIVSTHILSEVSAIADRVFIINRGHVMAVDTPHQLAKRLLGREVATAEIGRGGPGHPAGDAGPQAGAPQSADDVRGHLEAVPGAAEVSVETTERSYRVRIEMEPGVDLRPDLANAVVSRGWKLLGLAGETLSLEQIFLTLTADGDAAPLPGAPNEPEAEPEPSDLS